MNLVQARQLKEDNGEKYRSITESPNVPKMKAPLSPLLP